MGFNLAFKGLMLFVWFISIYFFILLMGISFFIYAFLFMPTFSGTQLGCQQGPGVYFE